MVSMLYVGLTWLAFAAARPLPAPAPVRFIARNTLFIFLAHMPLYYALAPWVTAWTGSLPLRSLIYTIAAVPGLALVSEMLRMAIRPRVLRERLRTMVLGTSPDLAA